MSTHVKHMGWQAELEAQQIANALAALPSEYRKAILEHLRPPRFKAVVVQLLVALEKDDTPGHDQGSIGAEQSLSAAEQEKEQQ